DLAGPDAHGGPEEAVAELPAPGEGALGPADLGPAGARAVEQQVEVVSPELGVAGHWLVVEAQEVGVGAEQHLDEGGGPVEKRRLVEVAVGLLPAVGARVAGPVGRAGLGLAGGYLLVQPARLGDADAVQVVEAREEVQQRDLTGQGQLARQPLAVAHPPEN